MAVAYNGGVVLGADSRTTTGTDFSTNIFTNLFILSSQVHTLLIEFLINLLWFTIVYIVVVQDQQQILKQYQILFVTILISTGKKQQTQIKKTSKNNLFTKKKSAQMGEAPEVHTAATFFQKLCYDNKNNLSAGIIVGGWDKFNGGSVYCIPLGGSMVKQKFAIGGSGSTFIYGYCDANFKDGMTKDECHEFVRKGLLIL